MIILTIVQNGSIIVKRDGSVIVMNELEVFLGLNEIDKDILMNAVHLDIRETILMALIDKMKRDHDFLISVKRCYCRHENLTAARKLVQQVCHFSMSDKDIAWLNDCITAHMEKKDTRSVIPSNEKKRLLERQDNRCAKCGKTITLSSMHVDHIVPWDYVGDELEHNRQGLCSVCNSRKSNHVAMAVSDLILNRRK